MPISPQNRGRYPPNWKEIRAAILKRAGHCCEGSPAHPDCRAANYEPHPETGSLVVLAVAHLDHQPEYNAPENLVAWCQRCRLQYDAEHHRINAWRTWRARLACGDLFPSAEVAR